MGSVASISDRVGDLGAYLREQRESASSPFASSRP